MSGSLPINSAGITAPTPQNTPLVNAPIAAGLSRPTVPAIQEDTEEGRIEDPLASLTVEQKRTVSGLRGIQVKQAKLQEKFKHEVWELERKYLELSQPLYDRRAAIISGAEKATKDEIDAGEEQAKKDDEDHEPLPAGDETAPIEDFWLTTLRTHIGISELITDRDTKALKYLTDVRVTYLEGEQPGFKLSFHFSPNEFFEDEVLEKTYLYKPEIDWSGDFVFDRARGTQIKWKEEKDLTKIFEVKKQHNKNTNRVRLVRKARPTDSFFNFFTPPQPLPENASEEGDLDDDEIEDLEARLEMDYQIGEDFKDCIIPRAVDYFTGKALEYEADDMGDDDFNGEFGDSAEDDSEDEDEGPKNAATGKKGGAGAGAGKKGAEAEECKQQ